jgi:hypothetical protein
LAPWTLENGQKWPFLTTWSPFDLENDSKMVKNDRFWGPKSMILGHFDLKMVQNRGIFSILRICKMLAYFDVFYQNIEKWSF